MTKTIVCISVLLLLAGCEPRLNSDHTTVVQDRPGPSFYFHEVMLKDGTRCVISTSSMSDGGTGVACDWRGEKNVE